MKAKVFRYKSDGNTVVAPYMELEPYAENVYLSLSEKNEYGNEDEDCFHVLSEHGGGQTYGMGTLERSYRYRFCRDSGVGFI